jgi:ATP-dependent RNA helicase HelY
MLPLLTKSASGKKNRIDKQVLAYLDMPKPPRLAFGNKLPPFGDILRVLRKYRLLPAIFFLKSRADCDNALKLCAVNLKPHQHQHMDRKVKIQTFTAQNPYLTRHRQLMYLEKFGVGAHHGGQLPVWKLLLEKLMTKGMLEAVFATSTVAAGVNFPARSIVLLNSDRFNGKQFLPLNPTQFHQMTGRAGRRGMDRIGFSIVIPGKYMDIRQVAGLTSSQPTPVESQIKINFSLVLNLLLSHTPQQIEDLLEKSFAAYTNQAVFGKHADGRSSPKRANDLYASFLKHLKFLEANAYATPDGKLTSDGVWASQLRVDLPLMIAQGLKQNLFPHFDPALFAAIMASFVNEQESDNRISIRRQMPNLFAAFFKLKEGLQPFAAQMAAWGFPTRLFFLRPALAVYQWACGQPWEKVLAVSHMEAGNLVMLILRTADNMRHVKTLSHVFPESARAADNALELILHDPVVMDYGTDW